MESFTLHSPSTTASFSHHHPSRLSLLCSISSRSPPPTISLPSLPDLNPFNLSPSFSSNQSLASPKHGSPQHHTPRDTTPLLLHHLPNHRPLNRHKERNYSL
ncbi:hypothetical protein Bca52824_028325 [Brassica carinata]|uniref:Uncharacterized protein n=1 Tax=Brassica carinata TaxID=52824 RepID=A0A8X8ARH7_BRACI|nr:hypothetical protein Bca52824_028325 [Brassica carinata]